VDGHVTYGRGLMHANFFETSVMLHLRPTWSGWTGTSHTDVDSFWDYRMDQVSETGVWGRDVAEANAEHGKAEFERCVRHHRPGGRRRRPRALALRRAPKP
jgi:creatinine amidohydrolase